MITLEDLLEQGVEFGGAVCVREWSEAQDEYIVYYDGNWQLNPPEDDGGFGTEWMRTGISWIYADGPDLVVEVGVDD